MLLSVVNVLWMIVVLLVLTGVTAFSWLGGPVVGAVGTVFASVLFLLALARCCLSVLLFMAGWRTWQGHPSGVSLHTTWAWITIALDVVNLMITSGLSPASWWGLAYAGFVLFVMSQSDVRAYFGRGPFRSKAGGLGDDGF